MKARWKNQYHCLETSSQFHERARGIFCTDPRFKNLSCYQEVPVKDLCIDYPYKGHHFDWYIYEFGTVIELHGAQHYKPVNFSGIGYDDAVRQFRQGQFRDAMKQQAAVDAGFTYIEIPYTDIKYLDGDYIMERLND